MTFDIEYIQNTTKFSKRKRFDLHRYFYKLPEVLKVAVFKHQLDIILKNSNGVVQGKETEFHHAMFLLAINEVHNLEFATTKKNYKLGDAELEKVITIRASRIKSLKKRKPSKLFTKVEMQFLELIRRMRGSNVSWREISFYIEKYHKTKISHTYLSKLYQEVESIKNGRSNDE